MNETDFAEKPLKEVLLRLKYQAEPDERVLTQMREKIAARYPETRQRRIGGVSFLGAMNVSERLSAPMHASLDQRTAVQVGADGFYFSQLAPYEGWPQVRDEARDIWSFCRSGLNLEVVRSVSVRFINLFELPGGLGNLAEFLKYAPPAPSSIGHLDGFFYRWTVSLEDGRSFARVVQATRPPFRDGRQRIMLDIDVTTRIYASIEGEELWMLFTRLRDTAHKIFRDSLTSKANELVP